MNQEDIRVQRIKDKIPEHWGKWVSVPDEWLPIVVELDERISSIRPDYEIWQVKEKFWRFRFYYDGACFSAAENEQIREWISEAEVKVAELEKRRKR